MTRRLLAIALIGGIAAQAGAAPCPWRAGEVLTLTGTVSEGGLSGPFSRTVEIGSGRSIERADFGVFAKGQGYDGELAWSQDVSGATHDLDSGFARALAKSEAWLAARQGCSGKTAAAPMEIHDDPRTGLPDRAVLQYAESHVIHHYADWRDVGGGRMVAFRQTDEDPEDEETTEYRIDHAEFAQSAAPGRFARPAFPADVHLPAGLQSTTIRYEDDHRTRIFVPITLNGAGPFIFEIDAGGHFILAPETAKALGLSARGSLSNTGAGEAVTKAGYVRVDELRVGDATIDNLPAKILPLSAKANDRGALPPRAGILGLEFFERFTIAFDRRTKTMTVTPRGEPYPAPKGVPLPLIFTEDAALVAGRFEGVSGDFMLDTGNAGATIIEQFWAESNGLTGALAAGVPIADGVTASHGEIALGPYKLPGELVNYYGAVARGSEYSRAVAGVLGEPLLSRFDATYDYARKLVWLDPVVGMGPLPFPRAGLVLSKTPGGPFSVSRVLDASPAAEAGLKTGDIVEAIDGKPAATLSRSDADALFRQDVGTVVRLGFRPAAEAPLQTLDLRLRDLL